MAIAVNSSVIASEVVKCNTHSNSSSKHNAKELVQVKQFLRPRRSLGQRRISRCHLTREYAAGVSSVRAAVEPVSTRNDTAPTSTADASSSGSGLTIREQLSDLYNGDEYLPLVNKSLADRSAQRRSNVSKMRNKRRQARLNEEGKRNDRGLFANLFLLLIVPPATILGFAVAVGYVEILP
jgi:hypothetical protein